MSSPEKRVARSEPREARSESRETRHETREARREMRDASREMRDASSEPRVANVERLVIRVPNWLGDAVMALPALAAVRAAFAGARIAIAAPASLAPLFAEGTPAAPDEVVTIATERD